ncbi:hypothetical protein B0A48_01657 [Cryoendolithus antarcticus]|uniref:Heterokaryon incompatibility domain-containing protein n=1 Tax=Cryoendolithus antarcticus TaxID=1507870 RepID=A0A1V8TPX6_9PEZI|nr:hypothetical protein B0A48_01657 [Cryoendolithus antarcticus]
MAPHQPLGTDHSIRLLRVHRGDSGPIVGILRSFELNASETPAYTPASYVWGDPADTVSIRLNDTPFEVLRSAYGVLQLVCEQPEFRDSPWLWIDSICIDLGNDSERASQVSLMHQIYGNAQGAIIWLGEALPGSERGMRLMIAIADQHEREDKGDPDPMLYDMQAWRDYYEIASRPWFRRIWTLQESILPKGASHTVRYYCGNTFATHRVVMRATVATASLVPKKVLPDLGVWSPMWCRRRIYYWHRGDKPGQRISLLALLAYTSFSESSKPVDLIYSLVGCINDFDRALIGRPRYDIPYEAVYTDLTMRWIAAHQSLDIICFAHMFRAADSDVPSWVPDWKARNSPSTIRAAHTPLLVSQAANTRIGSLRPKDAMDNPPDCAVYAASGESALSATFSENDERLTCQGIIIDNIDGLGAMVDGSDPENITQIEPLIAPTSRSNTQPSVQSEPRADISSVRDNIALSLVLDRRDWCFQYPASADFITAHLLTAVADYEAGKRARNFRINEFRAWFKLSTDFLVRGISLQSAFRPSDFDYAAVLRQPELEHAAWPLRRFTDVTSLQTMARRLLVTDKGFVGMAPRTARKGDVVAVLLGCSVPVVIRRTAKCEHGDRYDLVGECYLHGFMHGQAMRDGAYTVQDVVLI